LGTEHKLGTGTTYLSHHAAGVDLGLDALDGAEQMRTPGMLARQIKIPMSIQRAVGHGEINYGTGWNGLRASLGTCRFGLPGYHSGEWHAGPDQLGRVESVELWSVLECPTVVLVA
jgi:hypothetical protein